MRLQLPLHLILSAAVCMALLGGAHPAEAAVVPTTTTLAITAGGSAVTTVTSGTVVTLTATVFAGTTPVTPGQVNFCNAAATNCIGLNLIATAQLTSAGIATYKFRPGIGSHSYNAVFVGTPHGAIAAYASSTSSAAALTVTGTWPSITALAAILDSSSNTYNLTATVGGNGSTAPTGTVSFLNTGNGNAVLGATALGVGLAGTSFLNVTNSDLETISSPLFIAVGDFNGDGIPDLAVANYYSYSVTILLGNGDGTFTSKTTLQTEPDPEYIAVADFNGDGILDLAVPNVNQNTVTVFLGDGDGTFTATATSPATGDAPESITVGDFNGDGIPDMAAANVCGNDPSCQSLAGTVTILLGNGDGTFTASPSSPATGVDPDSIAVGDFNGDGIPDLAVANLWGTVIGDETGTVTVLLGNGDGTFTATATSPETGANPGFVAVGDFNGDGISDLAVSNNASDDLTILLGNGDGTFVTAANPPTGSAPVGIAVGDFNEDGIPDLAVANNAAETLTVLLGNGNGTFSTETTVSVGGEGSKAVAVADFNGDGVPDLAVQSFGIPTGEAEVLLTANYTATASNSLDLPSGTGIQQVIASYAGDSNYSASVSGAAIPGTGQMTPIVTVTPASLNITAFQALTVTVGLGGSAGSPTPTGSVTLTSGSYTSPAATLSSGTASITIPAGALSLGADTLTASYTPDSTSSTLYTGATGSSSVTVSTVTPTVLVSPASRSLLVSQALSVVVAVSGPSGGPFPTGSVTLTSGSYSSGAVILSSGSATINIPANSLSTGTDTLTAVYTPDSGSPEYTSASGTSTVVVSSFTPTVTVTPLATSILTTQALQVDVAVSGPSGDPTPTGSVDLTSGSYDSGAVTLSGGSAAISIPAGSLGAGTDTLSVSYTPDSASIATYSGATSSSSVTVTAPNGTPVVSSMSPAVETAGDDAFTLTVNGSGFDSGSTVYWGTSALTTQFVSAAQITAQVPASDIANSGTDSITVESPMPGGGTSNALQFEVDSSGSGSPSLTTNKATVTPGQSATYAVTLPSAPTAVTASCLNLPTGASCSYSSTASTMTIATSKNTPAGTYQVTMVFTETVTGAASAFIFLPLLMLPLVRARRKWTAGKIWFTACLGLVLLVASASIGCGGGGASSTPPPPSTHQVTTSAVVTLTVQ